MLAVFTLCFAATAGAQATVKGTVVDADSNEPLIGATVTVGGTSLGTVTDYEGNFTLKVTSAKATIEIKYLGYLDKSIKLTQQGEVNWGVVKMNLDTHTLGDVVVTSAIAVNQLREFMLLNKVEVMEIRILICVVLKPKILR